MLACELKTFSKLALWAPDVVFFITNGYKITDVEGSRPHALWSINDFIENTAKNRSVLNSFALRDILRTDYKKIEHKSRSSTPRRRHIR